MTVIKLPTLSPNSCKVIQFILTILFNNQNLIGLTIISPTFQATQSIPGI